jgi:hypothetical protein
MLKIDMRKVNLNVIKPWIAKKIVELIGFEDDILIGYAMELLDEPVIASLSDTPMLLSSKTLVSRPQENATSFDIFPD